jgi:hypothetical protein
MIDTVTRLDMAVGLLTRPSKHRILDPETGRAVWVTADPLLIQLFMAVKNSTAGATFKSGSINPPLPLSGDALDLFAEIENVTAERWWALHRLHFGEGRATLGARIRTWAAVVRHDPDLTREAEQIMSGWVRDIKALLDPVRRAQIIGACPECGETRIVARTDDDGGTIMEPALSLVYSENYPDFAVCRACGTEWRGYGLTVLADAVRGGDGNDVAPGNHVPSV